MTIFIVLLIIQLTTVWSTFTVVEENKLVKKYPFIVIEPLSSREYGSYVVKRVQETLNLTCTVFDHSTGPELKYNITWTVPSSLTNSKNHIVIQSSSANSLNLIVPHLETRDAGEYACQAQPLYGEQEPLITNVTVNIKNRKCGEPQFFCNLSKLKVCIHPRYKCDGHQDCQMGEDEDQEICGESPCSNKLQCEDPISSVVRCIPKSWCCNIRVDVNCTIREPLSCCPPIFHKAYLDERSYFANHQPHMTDMTFLQTTIYTVIGCAMVFMIVVTVLVIAICRVHMKRSLMTQCPANLPQSSHLSQNTPLYDLDISLNRGCGLDNLLPPPGFLVTYNINNGVQIVGHAINPPPYCEVISMPPKEGPPPPYTSSEALDLPETEALLQQPTTSLPPPGLQTDDQSAKEMSSDDLKNLSSEAETIKQYTPTSDSANANIT